MPALTSPGRGGAHGSHGRGGRSVHRKQAWSQRYLRLGSEVEGDTGAWDWAQPAPRREPPTSLEGTAQPGLAVPLVVTDGPVAAFGGCLGAVTPDTQLVPTALTVPGADLQGGGEAHSLAHGPGESSLCPPQRESLETLQVS